MFVIVKKNSRTLGKENHWLDLALKNLLKICRLVYVFCFFVTSTLGWGGGGLFFKFCLLSYRASVSYLYAIPKEGREEKE